MDNHIVRGVWTGPELTAIQKLCIRSYQDNGHEFHLYVSEETSGIPEGTILHDANEIVPRSQRARFTCASHFSDYFRVMLIHQEGGWYVDLDTICLRPFDFADDYVFVSENEFGAMRDPQTPPIPPSEVPTQLINGCIFKAPKGSAFLKHIIAEINRMDTLHPDTWIAVGPAMFRKAVTAFGYEKYVQPPVVFDGVSPNEMYHFVGAGVQWNLSDKSYTIHVRTSAWKENSGLSPNKTYPHDSLFEQLKRKHRVNTESIPAIDLAKTVQPYTMTGEKVNILIDLNSRLDSENVPGDCVEAGVCNGGSAAVLAHFAAQSRFNRSVWLFDSFEGLPEVTDKDLPELYSGRPASSVVGECVGSMETVTKVLNLVGADMKRVHIRKGWFSNTMPNSAPEIEQIAFLSLDSDWYESEKICLEYLYDKLADNGYLYADDFYYWPGCQQAFHDFFASRPEQPVPVFHQFGHAMWLQKSEVPEKYKHPCNKTCCADPHPDRLDVDSRHRCSNCGTTCSC